MKTVRVRVLVAVTDDGTYLAQGGTPFKGRLNDPRFGERMRGTGNFAELISRRFAIACKRCGLNAKTAEAEMSEGIHHHMTPPVVYHWIEADVPVPPPTERKPIKARRKS